MARTPAPRQQRLRGLALGRELRRERDRRGRSQEEVARKAGVSLETVRRIEQGKALSPIFFTVADIARQLGIKLDRLDRATRERQS